MSSSKQYPSQYRHVGTSRVLAVTTESAEETRPDRHGDKAYPRRNVMRDPIIIHVEGTHDNKANGGQRSHDWPDEFVNAIAGKVPVGLFFEVLYGHKPYPYGGGVEYGHEGTAQSKDLCGFPATTGHAQERHGVSRVLFSFRNRDASSEGHKASDDAEDRENSVVLGVGHDVGRIVTAVFVVFCFVLWRAMKILIQVYTLVED